MSPSHWVASLDTLIRMAWWQYDSRTPTWPQVEPRPWASAWPSVVTGAMDTHKDPGCGRAMDLDMALDSIPGPEVIILFLTTFRSSVLPLSIANGLLLLAFFPISPLIITAHAYLPAMPGASGHCSTPTWAVPVAPGRSVGVSSASPLGLENSCSVCLPVTASLTRRRLLGAEKLGAERLHFKGSHSTWCFMQGVLVAPDPFETR